MPANAALYLPIESVDLADVFPDAKPAGGFFDSKSAFRVPFKDTSVRFNVMPRADVPEHLEQLVAYIDSLQDTPVDKKSRGQFSGSRQSWNSKAATATTCSPCSTRSSVSTRDACSYSTAWCFTTAPFWSVR
jgi:hypothetical protein